MLFYLLSWTLLVFAGAAIGSAMLVMGKSSIFHHFGDRMIAATWLGLLTVAAILLGFSVAVPLSPAVGFGVLIIFCTAAMCLKSVRQDLRALLNYLTKPVAFGGGILAMIAALNSTRLIEAYDTGLYHYPLTRWLSTYGTVPGLALIHFRFGFSSSWFALAAPFDFGVFHGRIAAMLGGLAIFLCLAHFALAVSRLVQRRGDRADWFLAGGYPFILFICYSWAFEDSLSPDVPVWILTLLVGWLMLVAGRSLPDDQDALNRGNDGAIAVLLVSVCTLSLKPSAAPIFVVAAIFYWFYSSRNWLGRIVSVAVAGLIAVPVVLANITSSGCPLYPNSTLCLAVPWGVGKAGAQEVAAGVADWGRWRDASAPAAAGANWLTAWIMQPDKLMLLAVCGICFLGFIALRGWKEKSSLYVLGLALFGTVFVLVNAPNPRFGVGYFSLYPALLLAVAGPKLTRILPSESTGAVKRQAALAYALLGIAVLIGIEGGGKELKLRREMASDNPQVQVDSQARGWHRLLLPPALASAPGDLVVVKNRRLSRIGRLELITDTANGFEYRSPADRDQCWGAALPCVPAALESDVGLRSPSSGFSSGFVHVAKAGNLSRR